MKNPTISVDISPIKSNMAIFKLATLVFLGVYKSIWKPAFLFWGQLSCASSNHFGVELKVPLTWRAGCCDTSLVIWTSGMDFWRKYVYIYIYPRGRRFTGNSCAKGVYIYEVGVGLGWGGGVGMVTFLELAHTVGATQVMGLGWGWGGDGNVPWTCTHGRCYASHGIGVGWGGDDNVPWTCTHGRCYAMS